MKTHGGWAIRIGWWMVVAALLSVPAFTLAAEQAGDVTREAAWAVLQNADGIVAGGEPGSPVRVQVVFDANDPYDARLYTYLKGHHPNVAVRWVPVA